MSQSKTKDICPCCGQVIRAAKAKAAPSPYRSEEMPDGRHIWYRGDQQIGWASFPVSKRTHNDHRRVEKMKKQYNTAERNAKLGYTGEQWTRAYLELAAAYRKDIERQLAALRRRVGYEPTEEDTKNISLTARAKFTLKELNPWAF